jgi:predicted nucleotidyltransferase
MPAAAGSAPTLADVQRRREAIVESGRRNGVTNVRVFGSVARGDASGASDLDLLVDVEPGHGLLALSAFAVEVEDLLHVPVQVATVNGLKARIRQRVLAEAVPL